MGCVSFFSLTFPSLCGSGRVLKHIGGWEPTKGQQKTLVFYILILVPCINLILWLKMPNTKVFWEPIKRSPARRSTGFLNVLKKPNNEQSKKLIDKFVYVQKCKQKHSFNIEETLQIRPWKCLSMPQYALIFYKNLSNTRKPCPTPALSEISQ